MTMNTGIKTDSPSVTLSPTDFTEPVATALNKEIATAADAALAKAAQDLEHWSERATWTDAQFLAEYCAEKRLEAQTNVAASKAYIDGQKADAEYVRKYGTDEG
jgi:hypothetical protein